MGLVGRIVSFVRGSRGTANKADVIVDPGSGANVTGEHFSDVGDDSQPLLTDIPVVMPINGGRRFVVVGYIDGVNVGKTAPGEKRIYARDPAGAPKAELWLKGDGTFLANGLVEIDADGNITTPGDISAKDIEAESITVTGDIEATTGDITATLGDVVATTVSLKLHVHPGVTSGTASTGVPTP